jgi:hypothetical protein
LSSIAVSTLGACNQRRNKFFLPGKSSGTQNVKKMSDMRVDGSLQKKMKKTADQHARIPHIGKSGTP